MKLSPDHPATRRTLKRRSVRRSAAGLPVHHHLDVTRRHSPTTTATTPRPRSAHSKTPARPVLRQQWTETTTPDGRRALTARWLIVPSGDRQAPAAGPAAHAQVNRTYNRRVFGYHGAVAVVSA
jgi:hypothetical protein